MTLQLLMEASDGLLAVSDGRRTRTEPGGEPSAVSDRARKVAFAHGASVIAMAAGRINFSEDDAADVLEASLEEAVAAARKSGQRLTVLSAAWACFEALKQAEASHRIPERGATVVVAGFDDNDTSPSVYEFTIPDTSGGPQPSTDFHQERFLARPAYNDTSDRVRGEFGLLTTVEYLQRLDDIQSDSTTDFVGRFSEAGCDGTELQATVLGRMADFLERDVTSLDREGVGGHWRIYRVNPGREVQVSSHSLGPMRATDAGVRSST